jgi:hypothetical protein
MIPACEINYMNSAHTPYTPEMQFVLVDEPKRTFATLRYCYLGSIDDWIPVGRSGKLPRLVKRYVKHLGKESFVTLLRSDGWLRDRPGISPQQGLEK